MTYEVTADLTVGVRFLIEADSEEEAMEIAINQEACTLARENMMEVCFCDEAVDNITIDCDEAEYSLMQCRKSSRRR